MWLASVTMRNLSGKIIPTADWAFKQYHRANSLIERALSGLGSIQQERQFRMCSTLCRHRAVSNEEALRLPESFYANPMQDIAGGPVEVIWNRGIPDVPSVRPCEDPNMIPGLTDKRLLFPVDCGFCSTCLARKACKNRLMRRPEPDGEQLAVQEITTAVDAVVNHLVTADGETL